MFPDPFSPDKVPGMAEALETLGKIDALVNNVAADLFLTGRETTEALEKQRQKVKSQLIRGPAQRLAALERKVIEPVADALRNAGLAALADSDVARQTVEPLIQGALSGLEAVAGAEVPPEGPIGQQGGVQPDLGLQPAGPQVIVIPGQGFPLGSAPSSVGSAGPVTTGAGPESSVGGLSGRLGRALQSRQPSSVSSPVQSPLVAQGFPLPASPPIPSTQPGEGACAPLPPGLPQIVVYLRPWLDPDAQGVPGVDSDCGQKMIDDARGQRFPAQTMVDALGYDDWDVQYIGGRQPPAVLALPSLPRNRTEGE